MSYLQKTILIVGSQAKLASKIVAWHEERGVFCTLSQQGISKWSEVPPEHCRAIEEITCGEVTRYDLRPDVFGPSPSESTQLSEAA